MLLHLKALKCPPCEVPEFIQKRFDTSGGRIGRDGSCDLVLPEKYVSREHAEIRWQDGGFVLKVLSRHNGVLVNDRLLETGETVRLADDDRIEVGDYVLQACLIQALGAGPDSAAAAAPPAMPAPAAAPPAVALPVPGGAAVPGGPALDALDEWLNASAGIAQPGLVPSETPPAEFRAPPPAAPASQWPTDHDLLGDLAAAPGRDAVAPVAGWGTAQPAAAVPPPAWPAEPDLLSSFPELSGATAAAPGLWSPQPAPAPPPAVWPTDEELMGGFLGVPAPAPAPTPARPPAVAEPEASTLFDTAPLPRIAGARADTGAGAGTGASGAELVHVLAEALGLASGELDDSRPQETIRTAGELLRTALEGLSLLLQMRAQLKNELRLEDRTVIALRENNPLKHKNLHDALADLLDVRRHGSAGLTAPDKAVQEATQDVCAHEMAVMAGTRAALQASIGLFAPDVIEGRIKKSGALNAVLPALHKAKLWEKFLEMYSALEREAEDHFDQLLNQEFARAYAEQSQRLRRKP